MSGVFPGAGSIVEPPSMTRIKRRLFCVLAALVLLAPAARAETPDDSSAWIEAPVGKHQSFARRRELILLRAARLAEERGFTHFELMWSPDSPVEGGVDADAWKVTDAYGNASNAIHPSPLAPSPLSRPGAVMVRFCNESEGSCPGVQAHRVLLNLRQR